MEHVKELVVSMYLALEDIILPGWRKETFSQEPWEVDYDQLFDEILETIALAISSFALLWLILALFG